MNEAEIEQDANESAQYPTDEEVINAVMEKFSVSYRVACDLILAVVENMTVAN